MSTCPECGHQVAAGVNFCSNCGAPQRTNTGDTTRVIPVTSAVSEAPVEATDPNLPVLKDVPPGASVLVVVRGPNVGATFLLDQETVTAGRHPQLGVRRIEANGRPVRRLAWRCRSDLPAPASDRGAPLNALPSATMLNRPFPVVFT